MKDRIKAIMEGQHMTQQVFAQFIGISAPTLSSILNERTQPSLNIVTSIIDKLPAISLDWLINGKGPMYRDGIDEKTTVEPSGTGRGSESLPIEFGYIDDEDRPGLKYSELPAERKEAGQVPPKTVVKYVERPQRAITEIRIFYDDQTWETFVPKKKE